MQCCCISIPRTERINQRSQGSSVNRKVIRIGGGQCDSYRNIPPNSQTIFNLRFGGDNESLTVLRKASDSEYAESLMENASCIQVGRIDVESDARRRAKGNAAGSLKEAETNAGRT